MKAKQTGILLTIGMIVKNEEQYLPRCLEALRPLREALPCELIITDTGSTDRTLEIAAQYADEVRHFQWCDDYAAARNTTLEDISGEWYMYLDADEIFDPDISGVVDFFKGPLCKKFQAAALRFINYDSQNKPAGSFYPTRIIKRAPGLHFEGAVHEHLVSDVKDGYALQTVVRHYGYMGELARVKMLRYRPMMLAELEKNPDDPRMLRQLVDGYDPHYPDEAAQRKKLLERLIAICLADKTVNQRPFAFLSLVRTQWTQSDFEGVLDTIRRYFKEKLIKGDSAADIDMYAMRGFALFNLKQFAPALDALDEYRRLYRAFYERKLDLSDMGTVGLHGINDEYLMRSLYVSTQCCLALNDKERAKTYIGQVDISSLAAAYPDLPFLADEFGYMRASGDFARMGALCTQIMAVNGESVRLRFFQLVEKEFPVFDSQKLEAARALAAVKGEHKFLTLHRMRAALADGDSSQAAALAQALLVKQDAGADPYFADVLYCVMLCGQPLAPALDVFGAALEETLNVLAGQRPDFDTAVCAAFAREPFPQSGTPGELFRRTRVMLLALLRGTGAEQARRDQLADLYTREIISFCEQVYNLAALPEQERFILPAEHRFALGMREVNAVLGQGDAAACLQKLQALLDSCPTMHRLIKRRLDSIARQIQEKSEAVNEFERLAMSVKQQFYGFLKAGRRDACAEVLKAYAAVNPDDPEIDVMRRDFEQSFR